MADSQVSAGGVSAAPLAYLVPGAQEIIVKAAFASFDGALAAGSFLPCIRVLAPGNRVVGEYVTDDEVAAGASAEVSWFPGVKASASASGGIPSLSVASLTSGTAAATRSWDSLITNDSALYSIDGGDATKFRIAATAVYLFVLTRGGPQVVTTAAVKYQLVISDNSNNPIQAATPIDWDDASAGDSAQINNLNGSCVLDPQGDTDTPYYVQLFPSPAADTGFMILNAIRLSPTTEA